MFESGPRNVREGYCCRSELGSQHAFYLVHANKTNKRCTPQLFVFGSLVLSSISRPPFLPQMGKPRCWNCRQKSLPWPLCVLPRRRNNKNKNTASLIFFKCDIVVDFETRISSHSRKSMVLELSPEERLTPGGLGGGPVKEF